MMETLGLEHCIPREWFDNSCLTCFLRCPRKFFFQYGCGLRSEEHVALTYGTAMHCAVPWLQKGDMGKAVAAFAVAWGDRDERDDKVRNTKKAKVLMEAFMNAHRPGKSLYEIVPPPQGVDITDARGDDEVAFAVDVGLPIPFIGRIDAVADHRDTKERYVVEYKTSSWPNSNFINAFTVSPQTLGYTLAGSMLSQETFKGAIVEVLDTKKCTTFPIVTHYREWQMKAMIEYFEVRVGELLACEERGQWIQDFSGCNSYACFGTAGYPCDYAPLCQVEDWTSVMSLYSIEHWCPFTQKEIEDGPGTAGTDVSSSGESVSVADTGETGQCEGHDGPDTSGAAEGER